MLEPTAQFIDIPLLTTFTGHTDSVRNCALTDDSSIIVTHGRDGRLLSWDKTTGKSTQMASGFTADSTAFAVNSKANKVLLFDRFKSSIWDIASGEIIQELNAHQYGAAGPAGALTSDGDSCVIVDYGFYNNLSIGNTQTGKWINEAKVPQAHTDRITQCVISADDRLLITGSHDKTLKLWDMQQNGKYIKTFSGHEYPVSACAIDQSAKKLVSADNVRYFKIWDIPSGECIKTLETNGQGTHTCQLSSDGRILFAGMENSTIEVWDIDAGKLLVILKGHQSRVLCCALSGNGKVLITGSQDKTLKTWDVSRLNLPPKPRELPNNPSATSQYLTQDINIPVQKQFTFNSSGCLGSCRLSDDSKLLITTHADTLNVWDLAKGTFFNTISCQSDRRIFTTSTDARLITFPERNTLMIIDLVSGLVFKKLEHEDKVVFCEFMQNQKKLVTVLEKGTLRVWDVVTWQYHDMFADCQKFTAGAGTADGKIIALASDKGIIKLWDIETHQCLHTLTDSSKAPFAINACLFSTSGRLLISCCSDKTLKIWNVETGKCQLTLLEHTQEVKTCALSQDDRFLISGAQDKLMKIWDLEKGQCIKTIKVDDCIYSCVLSNDGKQLITTGASQLTIWNISALNLPAKQNCVASVNLPFYNIPEPKLIDLSHKQILASGFSQNSLILAEKDSKTGFITLSVWDIKAQQQIQHFQNLFSNNATISLFLLDHSGTKVVIGSSDRKISIFDLNTGQYAQSPGNYGVATTMRHGALSDDNSVLLTSDANKTLWLWNLQTQQCVQTIRTDHKQNITACALNASGTIAVSGSADSSIKVWDINTGKCIYIFDEHKPRGQIKTCKFIDADNLILSGAENGGGLKLWAINQNTPTKTFEAWDQKSSKISAIFSSDKKFVITEAHHYYNSDLIILDFATGERIKILKNQKHIQSLHLSLDNQTLISIGNDKVKIWDLSSLYAVDSANVSISALAPLPMAVASPAASAISSAAASAAVASAAQPTAKPIPFTTFKYNEIKFDDPRVKLGQGAFGIVYKGSLVNKNLAVAVKELEKVAFTTAAQKEFMNEATVQGKLQHPHIVILYGAVTEEPRCLVMELLDQSLTQLLHDTTQDLPWELRMRLGREIADGINYLHANNIIHRDIKSMNVLLKKDQQLRWRVKVGDFGLAKVKSEVASTSYVHNTKGTAAWMAPEFFAEDDIADSALTDAYALGMTLWEIASREIPYATAKNQQIIIAWKIRGKQETIPEETPSILKKVIEDCWVLEPKNRPSASAIMKSLADWKPQETSLATAVTAAVVTTAATIDFASNLDSGDPFKKN
jgi:WD40 repeat protein